MRTAAHLGPVLHHQGFNGARADSHVDPSIRSTIPGNDLSKGRSLLLRYGKEDVGDCHRYCPTNDDGTGAEAFHGIPRTHPGPIFRSRCKWVSVAHAGAVKALTQSYPRPRRATTRLFPDYELHTNSSTNTIFADPMQHAYFHANFSRAQFPIRLDQPVRGSARRTRWGPWGSRRESPHLLNPTPLALQPNTALFGGRRTSPNTASYPYRQRRRERGGVHAIRSCIIKRISP